MPGYKYDVSHGSNRWKSLLRDHLHEQAQPVFSCEDTNVPPASIWTGSRLWVEAFRNAGMVSGDTIAISLPPGPAFAQVFAAALWEDLTVAALPPTVEMPASTRVLVTTTNENRINPRIAAGQICPAIWFAKGIGGPELVLPALPMSNRQHRPNPLLQRLLLHDGQGWASIGDAELFSTVQEALRINAFLDQVITTSPAWTCMSSLTEELLAPTIGGASQIVYNTHNFALNTHNFALSVS
jgi:hypothetical protein